jgi:hypothetical protein
MLADVQLLDAADEGYWLLTKTGCFTSKSLYDEILYPGV